LEFHSSLAFRERSEILSFGRGGVWVSQCVGTRFLQNPAMILLLLPMMSNQNDYQEHYQGRAPLLVHHDS